MFDVTYDPIAADGGLPEVEPNGVSISAGIYVCVSVDIIE